VKHKFFKEEGLEELKDISLKVTVWHCSVFPLNLNYKMRPSTSVGALPHAWKFSIPDHLQLSFLSTLGARALRWFTEEEVVDDTPSSDQLDLLGRLVLPKCNV
jgi:hypothetical protein